MKVVFKVKNAATVKKAVSLISLVNENYTAAYPDAVAQGNLGYAVTATPVHPVAQALNFDGRDNTVTFDGTRDGLMHGGGHSMETITAIFGSIEDATKAIVRYETGVKLPWYTTLNIYIDVAGRKELVALIKGATERDAGTQWYKAAVLKLAGIIGAAKLIDLNDMMARVFAEHTGDEISEMRLVLRALKRESDNWAWYRDRPELQPLRSRI